MILQGAKQRKDNEYKRKNNSSRKNKELDPKEDTYFRKSVASTMWLHAKG
jgi:hypothetical protein